MNDKAIKEWVKQNGIVEEVMYGVNDDLVKQAIDQAIDLAIKKTMREANAEKENIRQKLIEDLKQYEKENIDTVRQSRLFAVMLNDIVEIINRCFGGKND